MPWLEDVERVVRAFNTGHAVGGASLAGVVMGAWHYVCRRRARRVDALIEEVAKLRGDLDTLRLLVERTHPEGVEMRSRLAAMAQKSDLALARATSITRDLQTIYRKLEDLNRAIADVWRDRHEPGP